MNKEPIKEMTDNIDLEGLMEKHINEIKEVHRKQHSLPEGVVVTADEYIPYLNVDKAQYDSLVNGYVSFIEDILTDTSYNDVVITARYRNGNEVEFDRFTASTDESDSSNLKVNVTTHTVTTRSVDYNARKALIRRTDDITNGFMEYVTREV